MSEAPAKKVEVDLTWHALVPVNPFEIMTLMNFEHIDVHELEDRTKDFPKQVRKEKSGFTHEIDPGLLEILRKIDLGPPAGLLAIYGEHFALAVEYNEFLRAVALPELETGTPERAALKLIGPTVYKAVERPKEAFESPLFDLRHAIAAARALPEAAAAEHLRGALAKAREDVLAGGLVETRVKERKDAGLLGKVLPFLNRTEEKTEIRRIRRASEIARALETLSGTPRILLDVETRLSDFAKRYAPLLALMIATYRQLGVDPTVVDSPNFDYHQFYLRYVGADLPENAIPEYQKPTVEHE